MKWWRIITLVPVTMNGKFWAVVSAMTPPIYCQGKSLVPVEKETHWAPACQNVLAGRRGSPPGIDPSFCRRTTCRMVSFLMYTAVVFSSAVRLFPDLIAVKCFGCASFLPSPSAFVVYFTRLFVICSYSDTVKGIECVVSRVPCDKLLLLSGWSDKLSIKLELLLTAFYAEQNTMYWIEL